MKNIFLKKIRKATSGIILFMLLFSILSPFSNVAFASVYSVPGQIDNADNSFVSSIGGSIGLSNLEIGGVYTLMSGSNLVSSGVLVASDSTGTLQLNPSLFTNYGNYTLTLSGSYSGTTTSSIDVASLYIGLIDFVDLYANQVGPALASGGIDTNLGTVSYDNVMSFTGLYFEKTGLGKIYFSNAMDLTNSGTISFLQNLPSKLDMTDGHINFDPSNSDFANYGAQLYMYFDSGSTFVTGINDPDNFVVKSSTGLILDSSGVLSNVHGACEVFGPCTLVFDTDHFTTFDLKPILTDVNIVSNNIDSGSLLSYGDKAILTFTGSEALTGVTVTFNGTPALSVTGGGDTWIATSQNIVSGTGNINFTIDYSDLTGNTGSTVTGTTDLSSVTIDSISPSIPTITTTTNQFVNSTGIVITGTGDVDEYIKLYSGATVIGSGIIDGSGSFSVDITLIEGVNNIVAKSYDISGNYSGNSNTVVITRDTINPVINYEQIKNVKDNSVDLELDFTEANMGGSSTGFVDFTDGGTSTGTFNLTFSGNIASTSLAGLNSDSSYTYVVTLTDDVGNATTSTGAFSTAVVYYGLDGDLTETGSISFGFETNLDEGNEYNLGGNLYLNSDSNDSDSLTGTLTLSGVNILVSSGSWDGVLIPPTLIDPDSNEAATGSEVGSGVTIIQTIKTGSEGAGLSATGGYFEVSFVIPGYASGTTFSLYRSEDGSSWVLNTPDATCTLDASSMCTFRTDHLSFFAPGFDTAPDAFSFTALTDKELSTQYESNTITVAGIDTGSTITVTGGEYKIGTGSYTSTAGVVNNDETVTVRQTSSSSYSTLKTVTLTIGGVSANFNVTTKATTSGGGSSGGGSSGAVKDNCPNGDYSGDLYDKTCGIKPTGTGSTSSGTETGSTGGESGGDINGYGSNSFNDIGNSFAKEYIEKLFNLGIVRGYSDGSFGPNREITRAEFLSITMKALNVDLTSTGTNEFSDVNVDWMKKYVIKAKELGIIHGQVIAGKLVFRPNDSITRAEALAILFKTAKIDLTSTKTLEFEDNDFENWMLPYIIKAKELGIINGQMVNGKLIFSPNSSISRAEVAKIVVKLIEMK